MTLPYSGCYKRIDNNAMRILLRDDSDGLSCVGEFAGPVFMATFRQTESARMHAAPHSEAQALGQKTRWGIAGWDR